MRVAEQADVGWLLCDARRHRRISFALEVETGYALGAGDHELRSSPASPSAVPAVRLGLVHGFLRACIICP
jgi:hypothetical protein